MEDWIGSFALQDDAHAVLAWMGHEHHRERRSGAVMLRLAQHVVGRSDLDEAAQIYHHLMSR